MNAIHWIVTINYMYTDTFEQTAKAQVLWCSKLEWIEEWAKLVRVTEVPLSNKQFVVKIHTEAKLRFATLAPTEN